MASHTNFIELSVLVRKEGGQYASWCPELDVASCGDTIEEASENLRDAVDVFLSTLSEEGDFLQVLEEKGFSFSGPSIVCERPFLSSLKTDVLVQT